MALSSLNKGAECVPGESLPVGRDGPPAKKALSENKRRLVLSLAGTSWAGGLWVGREWGTELSPLYKFFINFEALKSHPIHEKRTQTILPIGSKMKGSSLPYIHSADHL